MPVDVTEPQGPRLDTASHSLHAMVNHAGMDALRQLVRQYPDITAHYRRRLSEQFRSHSKDCDPCHVGKQTRQPFRVSDNDYKDQPLQLIQTDTTGPTQPLGAEGCWLCRPTDQDGNVESKECLAFFRMLVF
jgi:hypothetical protein